MLLAALVVATLLLWSTPLVYPVKVLVVLFHEMSHGLAAMLTGGEVDRLALSADLGGVAYTRGGWPLAILPAGYLGSMAWGAALLLAASWSSRRRLVSVLLGGLLLGVTLWYVRSWFGFASGLVFAGLLILAGTRLSEKVNDVLLSFLGLTSMLYAVIDIKEDLISRTVPESDAYAFSQILPLPPVVWGAIWGLAAVAATAYTLKLASRGRD